MKKKISFVSLALLAIVAACALAGCTTNELSLAKRIALLEKYDAMSKQSGFFLHPRMARVSCSPPQAR